MSADPRTPAEWQDAVDWAEFLLSVDAARQYGLVTGGPKINAERCAQLVARGRELGYVPRVDAAAHVRALEGDR